MHCPLCGYDWCWSCGMSTGKNHAYFQMICQVFATHSHKMQNAPAFLTFLSEVTLITLYPVILLVVSLVTLLAFICFSVWAFTMLSCDWINKRKRTIIPIQHRGRRYR